MKGKTNSKRSNVQGASTNSRLLGGDQSAVLRARVIGSGSFTVNYPDIAGAVGCIATSTTALRSTVRSIRITRVKLIIPPPTAGLVNSGRLTWFGSGNDESQKSVVNSTNNPARTAVINSKPPPLSGASFWNDGTGGAFSLHAPIGTIVEVHVCVLHARPGTNGFIPTVVVAGLTTGDTYYAAMATNLLTIDDGN
jgi:hypothetical protein